MSPEWFNRQSGRVRFHAEHVQEYWSIIQKPSWIDTNWICQPTVDNGFPECGMCSICSINHGVDRISIIPDIGVYPILPNVDKTVSKVSNKINLSSIAFH